jgi:hypothetical protein
VKPIHNNSVVGSTRGTPALSVSHLAQDPSSRGGAHPSQTFEQRPKPRVGACSNRWGRLMTKAQALQERGHRAP